MISQMSPRERVLAILVGVIGFLLLNFFIVDYFLANQRRLRTDLARNQGALAVTQRTLAERAKWEQREAWLGAKQPKLGTSDDVAGGQLLDHVKEAAKKNAVTLVSQALRQPAHLPGRSSIVVEIETQSTWPSLIGFMRELQGPEQFIVFESANLKIDDKDATQMRASFKVARWFTPKNAVAAAGGAR